MCFFSVRKFSLLKNFREFNFRSHVGLRKYFNTENFPMYGMCLSMCLPRILFTSVLQWNVNEQLRTYLTAVAFCTLTSHDDTGDTRSGMLLTLPSEVSETL